MRQKWMASFKANLPWILGIMVAGLLPFLGFLFSGKNLFASDQIASPSWKFFFDALRHGELPLWSPLTLGGLPTYDALAGDGTYPPFLLLGMLLPIEKVVGINFVIHCLFGGVFAYVLVRGYFKLDRFLSSVLAVAYMLNTNYVSLIYSGHTGKFHVLTWLPLGLYFLLSALEKKASWIKLLGLSLTITVMVLTSHLQLTYFVLMGYFFYYAYASGVALRAHVMREAASLALRFWGPVLLGIGLCFPLFWAPMQYNQKYSVRGEGQHQTYEHATSWSMHPEEAASLIVPEFGGLNERYWGRNPFKLNSEYPGIAIWVLGLFGLFAFRRGFFWLWGSVGLVAIIYGLGADTPFFHLFYAVIPGIKSFRAPSMILFWLAAGLLLMSAQTLHLLTGKGIDKKDREKWSKRLLIAGGIAGGLLILGGLFHDAVYGIWNSIISQEQIPNFANQKNAVEAFSMGALRNGLLVLILVFAIRKWLLQEVHVRAFAAVLALVVGADLYWVDSNFIETYDFERMFPHEAAIDSLKTDTSAYRVFALPGTYPKGYAQYHLIGSVDGWVDQEYKAFRAYRGNDYNQNPYFMEGLKQNPDGSVAGSRFLDMLNVKYLLYRRPDYPGIQIAENRSALPRAWFVTRWESLPVDDQLQQMRSPDFNPHRLALIAKSDGLASGGSGDTAVTPVIRREMFRNNALRYRVQNDKEGILVVSENWFPYWRLRVDGKTQTLLRTDYLFRGVHLEPGEHVVEMTYVSEPLLHSLLVSLAAALGLIALCFFWARFGERRSPPAP